MLLAAFGATMGVACGGGGGVHSAARPRAPQARNSVAPAALAWPVLPKPTVIDRGSDFVAISGSLLRFGRWLAYEPDPALVERAYELDSAVGRVVSRNLETMHRTGERIAQVDRKPSELDVTAVTRNVVTLRLTEYLAHRELVDASGRVEERDETRTELYNVSIRRTSDQAPWRLNLVERQGPKIEVQLPAGAGAHAFDTAAAEGSGELGGGKLGVGIEAATPGVAVTIDAGSPSLPRLVHYVVKPLLSETLGSIEALCDASGNAVTGTAGIVFGWIYDVIAYTNDGRVISDTHECVPFADPNNRSITPPAPVLPQPPTVGDVWRAVALPRPVVGVNPVSRGVTGLTTRLWSGGPQVARVAATIDGFTVTGTARVVEYRFATDEGYLGASGPGSEANPADTHLFATKGAHTLSVSSVWRATVTMSGPGVVVAVPVDIDVAVLTATVDYPVVEVRSQLVG